MVFEDYLELLKYEICLKIGWVWMIFALMLMAMWLFQKWPFRGINQAPPALEGHVICT